MNRFNIPLVAEGLTTYAIERQNGIERHQVFDAPPWAEQRRGWIDGVLRGMAELDGLCPEPELLENFDRKLEQARGGLAVVPASPEMQKDTTANLRNYISALGDAGGDRRRQIAVAEALMQDMITHRPWDICRKELSEALQLTSDMLMRMTAQLPIRFTYITLRENFPSCINMSGFVSGTVKDAEAVKATELYKNLNQWNPEVTEWLASCSVYVGGNADPDHAIDADAFDMSIIRSDEYRFLKQPGIRYVETRRWNIPVCENIRVLRIAPGMAPEDVTMPNTLEAFQEAVGGYIEAVGLDANATLVCNEEGKLIGLPANRQVGGDIIAGTFLVVGAEDGEFCSLSDADTAHYAEQFAQPMPSHSEPEKPTQWEFYVL